MRPISAKRNSRQPVAQAPGLGGLLDSSLTLSLQGISKSCGLCFQTNPESSHSSQLPGLTRVQPRAGELGYLYTGCPRVCPFPNTLACFLLGHSGPWQPQGKRSASSSGVMLLTFPSAVQGVIQSDLNYSVILECLASYITPTPVLHWTLDGEPYDTGNMLIIRRLSWGHLGTYVCTAKNSQGEYPSDPVTISLPQDNVEPTDAEPIEPDPVLSVSGGAAVALLVAANVGAMMLIGGVGFTIVQSLRIHRRRLRMCC
ncbi:Hypothetical predicted protein [Lynx pardinus]|uniref:Ig-like domain-containing protein n=1 Tax=Lynx pardinus TaxID=191816 RepID=A0A485NJT9_LYNPA|nr:Hypothetical predicted protein [Lynx pardinus]